MPEMEMKKGVVVVQVRVKAVSFGEQSQYKEVMQEKIEGSGTIVRKRGFWRCYN
jgi:hypothetical protein